MKDSFMILAARIKIIPLSLNIYRSWPLRAMSLRNAFRIESVFKEWAISI